MEKKKLVLDVFSQDLVVAVAITLKCYTFQNLLIKFKDFLKMINNIFFTTIVTYFACVSC